MKNQAIEFVMFPFVRYEIDTSKYKLTIYPSNMSWQEMKCLII